MWFGRQFIWNSIEKLCPPTRIPRLRSISIRTSHHGPSNISRHWWTCACSELSHFNESPYGVIFFFGDCILLISLCRHIECVTVLELVPISVILSMFRKHYLYHLWMVEYTFRRRALSICVANGCGKIHLTSRNTVHSPVGGLLSMSMVFVIYSVDSHLFERVWGIQTHFKFRISVCVRALHTIFSICTPSTPIGHHTTDEYTINSNQLILMAGYFPKQWHPFYRIRLTSTLTHMHPTPINSIYSNWHTQHVIMLQTNAGWAQISQCVCT